MEYAHRGDSPTSMNKTRWLEWMLASLLIAWGISVLGPTQYFDGPIYTVMAAIATETRWGVAAICCGLLRYLGLGINGWWKRSPLIRLAGAIAGGLAWLCIAFLMYAGASGGRAVLPPGWLFYPVYLGFEGLCVLSTGYDISKNRSLSYGAGEPNVARRS